MTAHEAAEIVSESELFDWLSKTEQIEAVTYAINTLCLNDTKN